MRRILYLAAVAATLGIAAGVNAQGGGMGGMGGMGGGSSFGGGTTGGSSFGGTSTTGGSSFSGGTGNTFSGGGSISGNPGTTTVPGRTGAGGRTLGGTGVSISPTNFLAATYGNPLYSGRPGSTNISPLSGGGFGQPSFGATTTGTTGRTTGTNLNAGRMTGGTATVGTNLNAATQSIVPITYTTEIRFPVTPIQPPQVQADLQALINRTTALRQPSNVRIEVNGDVVIIRGRVADDDERRLVEGMVRMEPGIRQVRNELTIP